MMGCAGTTSAVTPVFPGAEWKHLEPAGAGLDRRTLEEMAEYLRGRGCVTRHGYMVFTWGDHTRRGDVASAAKPWYSTLLFKAVEEGKLTGLDEKAVNWEPRLAEINPALGHKDTGITFRHFANQTSCYGVRERPGEAYDYNDWQMALFWDTLFLKVCGATYENADQQVLHPLLTGHLQAQDEPTMMVFGTEDRPGRMGVSPRDFCRFGLLFLNEGNWNGRQVISQKHALMAVRSPLPLSIPRTESIEARMIPAQRSIGSRIIPDDHNDHEGCYSWLWWVNGVQRDGKRKWPLRRRSGPAWDTGTANAGWPYSPLSASSLRGTIPLWTSSRRNRTHSTGRSDCSSRRRRGGPEAGLLRLDGALYPLVEPQNEESSPSSFTEVVVDVPSKICIECLFHNAGTLRPAGGNMVRKTAETYIAQ